MDLNEIQSFVSVARAGSFTAAAKQRSMPKSTVSRQVSRLEERLGVQLLHRTTRKLALTEAGQGYYARCLHAIEAIEDAERFALDLHDHPTGTLRVSMAYDMATLYIAPLLAEFHHRFPEVVLDIEMTHRNIDLVEEGFDVALRGGIVRDESLIARRIGSSALLLAAAPSYLDAYGRPETAADVAGHKGLLLRQLVRAMGRPRLIGPKGPEVIPLEPWLMVNDFIPLQRAAVDGLGIGLLESNLIAEDLAAGRLERVLPDYEFGPGGGLFAVYPATHHLTPKVRAFVDFVADELGPLFGASSG
jgi:DNA-binding transcriptional LysR family regulator